MVMLVLAVILSSMSVGCKTLEEYQALERANSVLEQDLSRAKTDLLDCENMLRQKKESTKLVDNLFISSRITRLTLCNFD